MSNIGELFDPGDYSRQIPRDVAISAMGFQEKNLPALVSECFGRYGSSEGISQDYVIRAARAVELKMPGYSLPGGQKPLEHLAQSIGGGVTADMLREGYGTSLQGARTNYSDIAANVFHQEVRQATDRLHYG